MGKFDGVLLVSDFDDTLYAPDVAVPERNVSAIRYFTGEGGRFTVATGRAHRTFAPYVHLVPLNAPVILSNGAAIYDFQADRPVEQTWLDGAAPRDLGAVLDRFPSLSIEAYHGEDIYIWNPNEITLAHMKKVNCDYTLCPVDQMPAPWVKALFHQDHETLLAARDFLQETCPGRYEAIFSNPCYLEITRRGCNKGGMVARLAGLLDIAPEHIYCVGDNQNDIPMLEKADIPFAPANCAPEVRDWGARVLCPFREGVIGDIVDILDKLY